MGEGEAVVMGKDVAGICGAPLTTLMTRGSRTRNGPTEAVAGAEWWTYSICKLDWNLLPGRDTGNDPDMLEVGNGGMSTIEYRSHFSLWAILAAPLMAGNDLRSMTPEIRDLLINKEVIGVNQDALGREGRRVWKDGDREVWSKEQQDGSPRGGAPESRRLGAADPFEVGTNWLSGSRARNSARPLGAQRIGKVHWRFFSDGASARSGDGDRATVGCEGILTGHFA